MVGLVLCLVLILIFYLFSMSTVDLKYENKITVKIKVPIFNITLSNITNREKDSKNRQRKISKGALIRHITNGLKTSVVTVNQLILPSSDDHMSHRTFYGYHALIGTALAYVKSRTKDLVIKDNSIIFAPNINKPTVDISIKTRFFNVIRTAINIWRDKKSE